MRINTPEPPQRPLKSRFLIDLAMHRDGLREMRKAEPDARHELLYWQTDHKGMADAGPLLVEPVSSGACATCRQWLEQGLAIELQGTRRFDDTATHLRTLTMTERESLPPALFRYADSRLYAGLQSVLDEHERARLLGPNEAMTGMAGNEAWTLRQPPLAAERYVLTDAPFRLTQPHLQGLQTWRERALLQPLVDQHTIPIERLVGWFQQMIAMGFDNEQTCFEGCQRLASLGFDQPLDSHCAAIQALGAAPWQTKLAALEARLIHARGTVQEAHHD
ncbi:protein of unknown function [Modicisalibacter muralis]|uniref:DUF4123 domain-containing protein n=2 Tax=Modicisalibacter muralis TaxID=119000 RepID=A0A1G9P9Q9_9GAMM|nr:protein of unknown function [Halomonas muralis]